MQLNSLVCEKGNLKSLLSWLKREADSSPQSSTHVNLIRGAMPTFFLYLQDMKLNNHVQGLHLYSNSYTSNTAMLRQSEHVAREVRHSYIVSLFLNIANYSAAQLL